MSFVLSLLILSQVLTDFYISENAVSVKIQKSHFRIFLNSSRFFICAFILTILFLNFSLFVAILCINLVQLFIKKLKITLENRKRYPEIFLFVIDQLLRVSIIVFTYPILHDIEPNSYLNSLLANIISNYPFLQQINNMNLLTFVVLVMTGLLFSIKGGTILSLFIINLPDAEKRTKNDPNKRYGGREMDEVAATIESNEAIIFTRKKEMKKYGKIIGNIERVLIIAAILINQYEIIAVIIAIKSIGRFKELDDKTSDYYIVGNFASLSIAFFIGIMLVFAKKLLLS